MKRQFCLFLIVLIILPAMSYGAEGPKEDKDSVKNAGKTAGILDAIAKILDAIAWPLAIIIVVVILVWKGLPQRFLEELADRLESISYKNWKTTFAKKFRETLEQGEQWEESIKEAKAKDLPGPDEEVVESTETEESRPTGSLFVSLVNSGNLIYTMEYVYLNNILQYSPRGAVIGAWYHAESALISLAKAVGIDGAEDEFYANILRRLGDMKLITNGTMELYSKFKDLKDNAAVAVRNWAKILDTNGPERYVKFTLQLAATLQEAEERFRERS